MPPTPAASDLNLPNLITLARLGLAPCIGWALLEMAFDVAAWLFIAASLSDWLDGFLARRWRQTTRLGALLDPIADKVMTFCTVLSLAWAGKLPLALAMVLIGRDVLILGAAVSAWRLTGTLSFPPSLLGKIHTVVVFSMLAALIILTTGWVSWGSLPKILWSVPVVTAVLSGGHYVWNFSRAGSHLKSA